MNTITEAALIARINRRLAHDGERLCRTRQGTRDEFALGQFYIVANATNGIVASHCDLDALGREIGVLREQEVAA